MDDMAPLDHPALTLIGGALKELGNPQQDEDRLELLKEAIDCLPIRTGITISDVQGRIVYVNAVQADMHGYSAGELVGMPARLLSPGAPESPFPQVGHPEGSFWNRECLSRRKSGASFPVLLSSIPVRNRQGRCIGVVTACEDITGHKDSQKQIEQLANYDPVTQLPNRALFMGRLQQAIVSCGQQKKRLALLFLDLDNFKDLNDTRGHEFGDKLLQEVARRLSGSLPEAHCLARAGGDEFVVMLGSAGEKEASAAARRLQELFCRPFLIDGLQLYSSTSIGIALYPNDGEDVETLLRCADAAMYHAKDEGKSNYQFFSREINNTIVRRVALETSIRLGLARGEFFLHYQPQWDLATNRLIGAEALLRWQSPEFGKVSPEEFIPIAEMSGLILELGEMVLRTACRQAKSWQESCCGLKVAINISGRQFSHPGFLSTVARVIGESGVAPSLIELELTESVIMGKADRNVDALRALKEMGVRLAIDDFGTGYSSLSYLKHFPIDAIKIDRSFIAELDGNSDDAAITEAIISLAHSLKLKVVAEGVEDEAQLQFLRARHCDCAQGYYFAEPMSAEELWERLAAGQESAA
ncbi:MAG TPA: EAL domain-containing protein [Geomonas sp.]|nr:EAL domain-containing protein [Geomonas sp.]